jgi:hypothetical protein
MFPGQISDKIIKIGGPNITAPSLMDFPREIVDIILSYVIKKLFDRMITQEVPVSILREYRALVLTCKTFKLSLENMRPKAAMLPLKRPFEYPEFDGHKPRYLVPKISFVYDDNIEGHGSNIFTTWRDIFMIYQKLMARLAFDNFQDDHVNKLGKFWLNKYLKLSDLREIFSGCPESVVAGLILLLGPVVKRQGRPPHELRSQSFRNAYHWINRFTRDKKYPLGEVCRAIKTHWEETVSCGRLVFSVRDWGTPSMSSIEISPDVKEWWVWYKSDEYFGQRVISGYYEDKAWVCWGGETLYTNFEQSEQIGLFEGNELIDRGYGNYWSSVYENDDSEEDMPDPDSSYEDW